MFVMNYELGVVRFPQSLLDEFYRADQSNKMF
jgi:hypothetical protein